jgi:hypothetical protein
MVANDPARLGDPVLQQELTTLRILEISGIDAEIVPADKSQPKWWWGRHSNSREAEPAAAAVA